MRRYECVPFDSIWKPSIGKDCSILFPTETTEYFIGAIVQKSKWNSDFPVIAVKTRKECYFRSYSKISKRFPLKKARSIWFPTRKVVVKAPSISTPDYWAEQIIHADICTLRNKFLWKKCWISIFMYGKHLPCFYRQVKLRNVKTWRAFWVNLPGVVLRHLLASTMTCQRC